jgi:mono/diheme cytochrome c family protein
MLRTLRFLAVAAALAGTLGCVRGCTSRSAPIHINPNMDDQPRYEAQASSEFFADGSTMRTPVAGTVARNSHPIEEWADPMFRTGFNPDGTPATRNALLVDDALVARGQDRFNIYCAPCHDKRGTGRGILFTRANIPTTSLHLERVRESADGTLFDVVTNGVGLMPGYRYPISARDRWAIIAYVRQMQAEHVE